MQIVTDKPLVFFSDLKSGDVFSIDGSLYMVVRMPNQTIGGVELSTGKYHILFDTTIVQPVSGKFIVD